MEEKKNSLSRRDFMRSAVATTIAAGGITVIGARSARGQAKKSFKIGLIGCGGRGNGAVRDCISAGKSLNLDMQVVALADATPDRIEGTAKGLKKQGIEIPKKRCFVGFDAYKKLIDTDVELVLMATPPNFRPLHLAATIEAGKHAFIEKPIAVDPVGCRKVIEIGEAAKEKGLAIVTGTLYRHHQGYLAAYKAVSEGAIGRVLAGNIYYCVGRLWYRERKPEWSDAEYLVRNWINFVEMSGDHIVEQHVHTIDVANWFVGSHPVAAVAMGGRAHRVTGNQFDFFSTDFEYPNGVHVHSMCRQVNGCWNLNTQRIVGEKGWTDCYRRVESEPKLKLPKVRGLHGAYVQEHIDLLDSIVKGKPLNEARQIAESTLTGIMGRESAYTGRRVKWDDIMRSDLAYKPTALDFETGKAFVPKEGVAPVPGKA